VLLGVDMALALARPVLVHENDLWIVRVPRENGKTQEYRCASEAQAKQLVLVLAPKPEAQA
jgi:hypothetical protein